ncbi:MAG: tail fiber domain-containing protein [bacterium]|nr:tail fiber domain-containing protein [bacterium]
MKRSPLFYIVLIFVLSLISFDVLGLGLKLPTISKVIAAVFDTDLIPSRDNTWNFGLPSSRWNDARFSGTVGVGIDIARESENFFSDRLVLGPTATSSGEGGQLKLLGTTTKKYTILDNFYNNFRIITRDGVGNETERVRVMEGGNVLIGASSGDPGEKLEVVGNIVSKGTSWATSTAPNRIWSSVAYGNGRFVAIASDGIPPGINRIISSSDGVIWTTANDPSWGTLSYNAWSSVTYGNGLFVAVAKQNSDSSCYANLNYNKCAMTSPDGINWTLRNTPIGIGVTVNVGSWQSVTYGNGKFVAVSQTYLEGIVTNNGTANQYVMTSSNGINWATSTTPIAIWQSVTYGNGRFVAVARPGGGVDSCLAVANSKCVMTSADGINWSLTPANVPVKNWNSVTYGNGQFVAVASGRDSPAPTNCTSGIVQCVMTSPDGINNWTFRDIPLLSSNLRYITYGNGLFVAVGNSGSLFTSPNGIDWTARISPVSKNWVSVAYGNGIFVAVAQSSAPNVMTSGKMDYQITPTNSSTTGNIFQGGMSIMGSSTGILGIGTTTPEGALHVAQGATIIGGTSTVTRAAISQTGALFLDINDQPIMGKFTGGSSGYHRPILNVNSTDQIDIGSSTDTIIQGIRLFAGGSASSIISFLTSNSEKMRIDVDGNVSIGTTTSNGSLYIVSSTPRVTLFDNNGGSGGPTNGNPAWALRASSSGLFHIESTTNYSNFAPALVVDAVSTNVGIGTIAPLDKLQVVGDIRIGSVGSLGCIQKFDGGPIVGACSSDLRLKKNLIPLMGSLSKLIQLKPTYFNWRADEFPQLHLSGETKNLGLIAQDVEKVFPELVTIDDQGFKRVNYGVDLTMHVIEAIKELKIKNDLSEAQIKTLEVNLSR